MKFLRNPEVSRLFAVCLVTSVCSCAAAFLFGEHYGFFTLAVCAVFVAVFFFYTGFVCTEIAVPNTKTSTKSLIIFNNNIQFFNSCNKVIEFPVILLLPIQTMATSQFCTPVSISDFLSMCCTTNAFSVYSRSSLTRSSSESSTRISSPLLHSSMASAVPNRPRPIMA